MMRGIFFGVLLSLPLWLALIEGARIVVHSLQAVIR